MKKKTTQMQNAWIMFAICIAAIFVLFALVPSIVIFFLTGQIPIDASHIILSEFWMGMSFIAIGLIIIFTLVYWYIKEHYHMHRKKDE